MMWCEYMCACVCARAGPRWDYQDPEIRKKSNENQRGARHARWPPPPGRGRKGARVDDDGALALGRGGATGAGDEQAMMA
jgi:hypothetical protein